MTRVASYAVAAAPGLPAAVFALPSAGERSLGLAGYRSAACIGSETKKAVLF